VETDDRAPTQHLGDTLSALIDGELTDDAAASARAHLAGCRACEAEMAAVDQVRSWLRDLPPVEPPADFYRRIRSSEPEAASTPATPTLLTAVPATAVPATAVPATARASTTATVRPRRRSGVVALVGCAAATAVVLGVAAPHDPETTPPVGRFIEAHATAAGGDPVTHLAPVVVPVSFRR